MNALAYLHESELPFRYSWLLLSNSLQNLRRPVDAIYLWCVSRKDRMRRGAMSVLKPFFHAVQFTEIVGMLDTFVGKREYICLWTFLISSENCLRIGFHTTGHWSGVHWRAQGHQTPSSHLYNVSPICF
jgi:hypothetical protein